ncbi:DUF1178 family protein [bacterium]|nr:DUF1178 family protein [bacterium]
MIRYALVCDAEHAFEAWFASSGAYDDQSARSLIECPVCGSAEVRKQIMAPAVRSSRSAKEPGPEDLARIAAKVRAHIAETHEFVGDRFADEARAMFYGDVDHRPVWGEVNPDTAKELMEEGVPATPLPAPFAPPRPPPPDKIN